MSNVVIVDAVRTPIGKRNGGLSTLHPAEVLGLVQRAAIDRTGIDPAQVGQIVGGCVSQVGEQSFNVARTAWLAMGGPLTVAENLFLGEPWPRHRWGGVNWNELHRRTRDRLEGFGLELDPGTPFHILSSAQKQEVAIARALSRKVGLLILDEPTASLDPASRLRFMELAMAEKERGKTLLISTHLLEDIREIADYLVFLRNGKAHRVSKELMLELAGSPHRNAFEQAVAVCLEESAPKAG